MQPQTTSGVHWNSVLTSCSPGSQPLPPSIKQLGLIDTLHYVGYGMTDVGSSLANLQVLLALAIGACHCVPTLVNVR